MLVCGFGFVESHYATKSFYFSRRGPNKAKGPEHLCYHIRYIITYTLNRPENIHISIMGLEVWSKINLTINLDFCMLIC